MEVKCAKCGKKLGFFDKVKLEDGYLCKKCAKEFKQTIDEKKVNFKELSIAELSNKEEEAKKKDAGVVIGLIAMALVGLLALAGLGGLDSSKENEVVDDSNSTAITSEVETEESEEEIDPAIVECEEEINESIGEPVSALVEIARKHEYGLALINSKKEDITEKYADLSDNEQANYRTTKIKTIDHDSKQIKAVAATLETLEKRMKKKFKKLDKYDSLSDAYEIAEEAGYSLVVKNRKGKRVDKKESFDKNDYVYISFGRANYDKKRVVLNADTVKHYEALLEAEEEKKEAEEAKQKEQAYLDATVYITPTGTRYHAMGCSRCSTLSPISRREAQRRGLAPCSYCHPDWGW